ncbi:MAG TPA: HAD family hydrolase [Actinomycetota bacterium]|jgi:phosphoglycolate phosphatase-like HAD superfamily hydrolase|nr:HAD family hydrolase [Actinomycetota bacterium]
MGHSGVRHLVWDWNGTLFDDHVAVVEAINDALALVRLGPIDSDFFRTHYTRPVERFYEQVAGRPIEPGEWRTLDERYHLSYGASVKRLELASDALEALSAAEAAGLTQSLLSMWRHHDLVALVERLGLGRFFLRVDGLRVPGGEAKTEHLVGHLDALEVEAPATALIGDSLDDLAAARAVGALCVLYDGGTHHRHALEATGAPVVGTLTEAVAAARSASGRRPGSARRRPAR